MHTVVYVPAALGSRDVAVLSPRLRNNEQTARPFSGNTRERARNTSAGNTPHPRYTRMYMYSSVYLSLTVSGCCESKVRPHTYVRVCVIACLYVPMCVHVCVRGGGARMCTYAYPSLSLFMGSITLQLWGSTSRSHPACERSASSGTR